MEKGEIEAEKRIQAKDAVLVGVEENIELVVVIGSGEMVKEDETKNNVLEEEDFYGDFD